MCTKLVQDTAVRNSFAIRFSICTVYMYNRRKQYVHVQRSDCYNKRQHDIPLHLRSYGYLLTVSQWFLESF